MLKTLVVSFFTLLLLCCEASAACSSFPNTLTNGTTADATQVMANFNCSALTQGATLDSSTFTGTTTFPSSSVINSSGILGLGTTSPAANYQADVVSTSSNRPLHMTDGRSTTYSSNNYTGLSSIVVSSASNSIGLQFVPTSPSGPATPASIGAVATTTNNYKTSLVFMTRESSGADSTRMVLDDSGNVNISGCLNYNGGTSGTCLSDIRVKKNVKPFMLGLSEISNLEPVTYEYNGLGSTYADGKMRAGLIAQQVKLVAPSLVEAIETELNPSDSESTSLLQVRYGDLTFALINAVKELKLDNDSQAVALKKLKASNDNQAAEIHMLDAKLSSLEGRIAQRDAQITRRTAPNAAR